MMMRLKGMTMMNKKIMLALSAMLLTFSAAEAQKLVILHVNDTHSHLEPLRQRNEGRGSGTGGVIERAAYVDSVRAAAGKRNVLLLHAGDFSQGTSYFTILNGDIEVNLINALKYDVVTIGNHEFDNGIDELARRLKSVKCPVVCANYDFSAFELGKYIKPYAIVHKAGMKIGVIGMLTDISTVVAHDIVEMIPRLGDYEIANRWAEWLKDKKHCDMVIVLSHMGFMGRLSDVTLARNSRNIDLIVGGHSHTFLNEIKYEKDLDGRDVPIVQDGCWGLNFGRIDVYEK